ncbi:MAG: type III-B CRISPR module RAMP protein Cmr1, partial [Candidatus Kryptonium sp.]
MNRVKIHCRAITPIFMSGVDGGVAELRASEFKGMMRWWWRAVVADDKIDRLKREESSIFGGTGAEEERKSKVELRIEEFKVIKEGNLIRSEGLEWRFDKKERRLVGKHAGIGYLLYSTILPGRERGYIKSGSEFDIVLRAFDDESFAVGLASLWLAIYLGGFGTRARRGGGN